MAKPHITVRQGGLFSQCLLQGVEMTRIESPQYLPSVDRLLNTPAAQKFACDHGLALVTRCAQSILARARLRVLAGESTDMASLFESVCE